MMGSRRTIAARSIFSFTVLLATILPLSDAQTKVGFEFLNSLYDTISKDVDNFQSKLESDITTRFNFTSSEVSSLEVTEGTDGRIRTDFTLGIDTSNKSKLALRTDMENSLRTSNYAYVYIARHYRVDSSTVTFAPSFEDGWHQYAFEITIVVVAGLAAFAIFVVSIQLLFMNRRMKRTTEYELPLNSLPRSRPNNFTPPGRLNNGFEVDDQNGGHRMHTPKSSIGSTRFTYDRNTLYNKLIYGNYEVPASQMYKFL